MMPNFLDHVTRELSQLRHIKSNQLLSTRGLGLSMYNVLKSAKSRVEHVPKLPQTQKDKPADDEPADDESSRSADEKPADEKVRPQICAENAADKPPVAQTESKKAGAPEESPQINTVDKSPTPVPHTVGKFARWRERVGRFLDKVEEDETVYLYVEVGGRAETIKL